MSAVVAAGLAATTLAVAPAFAATAPLSRPEVVAHFDVTTKQQPENITVEPDGSADLTFSRARQIAHVDKDGKVTILATLPEASTGTATVSGIVRTHDGTLYVNYNAGTASGVYRLRPGGTPEQIAALPEVGSLNGLALDDRTGTLYATDSKIGGVWRITPKSGAVELWASGTEFQPGTGGYGSNGIKVHNGAVWVGNTGKGTLTRIPVRTDGGAGAYETAATGLSGMDDFAFTGEGDTVLAAVNVASQVYLVKPDGTHTTVLTSADGLSNPTSVAVRAHTAYITSGAYFTATDPNLLEARISH
ncbi:SMP-30/gluconolactonase/LRE family protein [Streptomyces sp. NPDC058251]|uniref:SMP-30/gluconolactonase/LRE family protein n=1 Tax=Streptomyces sp. NPDC058251 TaxID=3346404 RepID=UPI0036E9EDD0